MLEFIYTKEFIDRFNLLDVKLKKKAVKQIELFKEDQFYPSLNNEKLEPKENGLWSIRIDNKYRILYKRESNKIILLSCGSHDWLYNLTKYF